MFVDTFKHPHIHVDTTYIELVRVGKGFLWLAIAMYIYAVNWSTDMVSTFRTKQTDDRITKLRDFQRTS